MTKQRVANYIMVFINLLNNRVRYMHITLLDVKVGSSNKFN